MQLLIPHLFPPQRMLETATSAMRAPALETLLARGYLRAHPAQGIEIALCQLLGIVRQQDWPIAPITIEAEGETAGSAYWMRADPVHLRVMRDRIVLADSSVLNLTQQESDALATSIREHFGEALQPRPLHPASWYIKLAQVPQLVTTPLSVACGRDIQPLMPEGEDAQQFRSMLNEVQMLLHDHPVNQRREGRGELAINALWLWGGGIKPVIENRSLATLFSGDRTVSALGEFCGAEVCRSAADLRTIVTASQPIVVLDSLNQAGQCGDIYGWWDALGTLERDWFVPLLGLLKRFKLSELTLNDPANGKTLVVKRADTWKSWHRPHKLHSILGRVS